jgi:hypothetical protein
LLHVYDQDKTPFRIRGFKPHLVATHEYLGWGRAFGFQMHQVRGELLRPNIQSPKNNQEKN